MSELSNVTAGTNNTGEVQLWLNNVHAFSIQYSATFIGILGEKYPAGTYGDGTYPGAVMYDKATAEKCFDKVDFLFQKYGLISARSVVANPALNEPRSDFGEQGAVAGATTPYMVTMPLDMSAIIEQSLTYYDGETPLNGRLIYKQMSGNEKRPGLVLYGGPWGDGGGEAEREYARVYAAKGMVVFLPDYFTETCGDTNQTTLMLCLSQYFGGFLNQTAYAQRIALLAYTALKRQPMVNSAKIGAMGFCFGGAMALQAARAGAEFEVAVSLHGEYPPHNFANPAPWATKYFVEMIGYDDPLIPADSRNAWMSELSNVTAGTNNTGRCNCG
jgi:dienelactone hydrolase